MIGLYASAIRVMTQAKTTISPVGGGMVAGSLWFFLFALICAFVVQKLAIEPEEKHLEARFGKRYRDYAKRVRRWI